METAYCEPIVECLRIAYRRGRIIREQQARERWEKFVVWMNSFLGAPSNIEWPEDDDGDGDVYRDVEPPPHIGPAMVWQRSA